MDSLSHHPFFPLAIVGSVIILLFLLFFPPMYVAIDEHQYFKNALLLQNGELKSADPLLYCGGIQKGDEYLSNYHIGKSFSLIPFTWLPFPFVLLSGLIIHLLNMGLFSLILRRLKINSWMVALFAFYPAFLWESRTLFSETFALTLLLAGVYFYVEKSRRSLFLSGLLFGLAAMVRNETILISLAFGVALLWNERHTLLKWGRSPVLFFIIGGILAALVLFSWNTYYNGDAFSTSIGSPGRLLTTFPQPLYLANLLTFVGILTIAFPLMVFLAPFFRPLRLELALATIFTLFFLAQPVNISVFPFLSPLTISARMRYLIPLAGILLIGYSGVLSSFIPRIVERIGKTNLMRGAALIGIILLVGGIGLHFFHQDLLEKRKEVSAQVLDTVPSSALVIGSSDDCIYFLPPISGERKYVKVNDSTQNIPDLIATSADPVYVMQLKYSNLSDSGVRQDTIDKERALIDAFIKANQSHLTQVFDTDLPHHLTIYAWK